MRTVRATLACGHRVEHTETDAGLVGGERLTARVSWLTCGQCQGRRRVEAVTVLAKPSVAVYEPDTVLEVHGVGYMVASRTTSGAWWLVRQGTCTCPATTARCHHMNRVDVYAAEQNKAHARPVAPAAPASMFID